MKNTYVYVIEVTPIVQNMLKEPKISCDAYQDMNNAIDFIESRADNPKRVNSEFVWISNYNKYRILFIKVV